MSRLIAFTSVLLLIVCAGCGDSFESLQAEGQSTMKKLVTTLDGVKDAESAKKAKPELKSLMEKLNDLNARAEKLGTPTEAQVKAVADKHGKEMEEMQQKLVGNMMRISFDPKIRAELDDLDAVMKKPLN